MNLSSSAITERPRCRLG